MLTDAKEENGVTTLRFYRQRNTSDSVNDIAIQVKISSFQKPTRILLTARLKRLRSKLYFSGHFSYFSNVGHKLINFLTEWLSFRCHFEHGHIILMVVGGASYFSLSVFIVET